MELEFTWINIVILFGSVQGLIFGVILWFNKSHPGARHFSIFMLALTYNGVETFSWASGLSNHILFFDFFAYILIFTVGPSLYLYIQALFNHEPQRNVKQELIHYGPALFQLSMCLTILLQYYLITWAVYEDPWLLKLQYDIYRLYSEPLSFVVFTCYLVAAIRQYRKAKLDLQPISLTPALRQVIYRWSRALLICLSILWGAWMITLLTPFLFNYPEDDRYFPVELGLVLFIYWIVFTGFHKIKAITYREPVNDFQDGEVQRWKSILQNAMELDKLYLNPKLSLEEVSTHTGLKPRTISAVLNQYYGKSYNAFVNEYRVNEVCKKMLDPDFKNLTLSGIAFESGFNSQATFQRAFKSATKITPRQYLAAISERN